MAGPPEIPRWLELCAGPARDCQFITIHGQEKEGHSMPSESDHDPTGHVWLGIGGWVCHICGEPVRVCEWLPEDSQYRWRWEHYKREEGRV